MRYSEAIANSIGTYLKEQDWSYDFNELSGTFFVEADLSCKLGAAMVVYQVTETGFMCYTTIEDEASAEMMHVVGEYLHRANYGLTNGNFEFDYESGSVHYKTYFECPDEQPTAKQLNDSMAIGLTVMDRYGDGLYELLHGGSVARQLIEKMEGQEG